MGDVRLQAFAGSLRAGLNPMIKDVFLKSNRIGDAGFDVLLSSLAEGKCALEHVDLSNNNIRALKIPSFSQVNS